MRCFGLLMWIILLLPQISIGQTTQYEDLLQHRSGFAKDVTGGAGGDVITITSVGDLGWSQLKSAVHEKDNPKWIRFSAGLSGTILIDQWLSIGSNTTIDGRGANITFKGKNTTDELFVWGDTNVIVHNIRFFEMGTNYDHGTAFGITDGDMVWLDHCTFEHNSDESVTIGNEHEGRGAFTCRLTLSYCRWENTIRAILLGHASTEGKNYQVTIHHCAFLSGPSGEEEDGAMYRIPVLKNGKAHMYNSYIKDFDWRATSVHGGGQALLENNIYEAATGAAMFCDGDSYDPEPGWICDRGNVLLGGTYKVGDGFVCDSVFEALSYYNYELDTTTEIIQSLALSYSGRSDEHLWITESSPRPYELTIEKTGVGKVTPSPSRSSYYKQEIVSLSAETGFGYEFSHWSGDISGTDNPIYFVMDTNKLVIANLVDVPIYKLTTLTSGNGRVSSMSNGEYNEGTEVTLIAFPEWSEEFIRWEGDLSGTENPVTISIDSNINITAIFSGATGIIEKYISNSNKYGLKCYPNPMTDAISVKYKLENSAEIKLTVINSTGQEVAVLGNTYQNPGEYSVKWNGTDASGNILINGMYLLIMEVDNFVTGLNKLIINK